MSFTPRTSKYNPSDMVYYSEVNESNKWWYDPSLNTGATFTLCLPNCTTYAIGRTSEILGYTCETIGGIFTNSGFPNASNWYSGSGNHPQGSWSRSQTPQLGAIACWGDGYYNGQTISGHVAIIEDLADGTDANMMLSMSGYVRGSGTRSFTNPGDSVAGYFRYNSMAWMRDVYEDMYNCPFQGYIINPYITPGPGPGPGPGPQPYQGRKRSGYNFVLYNRRKREGNYGN